MTYQFAEINGTKIHYEIRGEGTAPTTSSGTAVVLMHAGIVNLAMWESQMEAFTETHRVLRYDLRGWGETGRPDISYSDYGDLYELLTYLGIEKAVLVGVSFSGAIAFDFVLMYPQLVQKLVLVGPALGGYEWIDEETAKKDEAMEEAYERGDRAESAELETQIWFDGPRRTPEQVDQEIRRQAYEMVLHTHTLPEGQGERLDINPPAIDRLFEISMPTLLITGEEDVPDIHAIAQILQQNIPHMRHVKMLDTAHLPSMEKPAEFNQIVLSFIEE